MKNGLTNKWKRSFQTGLSVLAFTEVVLISLAGSSSRTQEDALSFFFLRLAENFFNPFFSLSLGLHDSSSEEKVSVAVGSAEGPGMIPSMQ